eukprot:4571949-Amphidinium_carterae.1
MAREVVEQFVGHLSLSLSSMLQAAPPPRVVPLAAILLWRMSPKPGAVRTTTRACWDNTAAWRRKALTLARKHN